MLVMIYLSFENGLVMVLNGLLKFSGRQRKQMWRLVKMYIQTIQMKKYNDSIAYPTACLSA